MSFFPALISLRRRPRSCPEGTRHSARAGGTGAVGTGPVPPRRDSSPASGSSSSATPPTGGRASRRTTASSSASASRRRRSRRVPGGPALPRLRSPARRRRALRHDPRFARATGRPPASRPTSSPSTRARYVRRRARRGARSRPASIRRASCAALSGGTPSPPTASSLRASSATSRPRGPGRRLRRTSREPHGLARVRRADRVANPIMFGEFGDLRGDPRGLPRDGLRRPHREQDHERIHGRPERGADGPHHRPLGRRLSRRRHVRTRRPAFAGGLLRPLLRDAGDRRPDRARTLRDRSRARASPSIGRSRTSSRARRSCSPSSTSRSTGSRAPRSRVSPSGSASPSSRTRTWIDPRVGECLSSATPGSFRPPRVRFRGLP